MIASFKKLTSLLLLSVLLSLTACSSEKPDAAADSTSTPAAATEAPAAGNVSGGDEGAAANAEPVTTDGGAADGATTVTGDAGASEDTVAAVTPEERSKLLNELLALAKQGKVPGVEYAAHSGMIDEVEAAWGEPDLKESAGKGVYSTYSKKNVVFGFNKGMKIFDVRSSAPELQSLTLKQIEAVLGKPDATAVNGEDNIYIYQADKQYQLKFIIPTSTGTVNHISVFSEQDSFNNMAG
ncbi:YjgB family protein [Paenibacillus piscarius]|uniref:YjgB family protein n=1 Tax=Paenibacillus piscarius TaxID=1089681 RepID=UPI001EE8E2C7|nr:YjgB family protein [Paenibacillus piscarius]